MELMCVKKRAKLQVEGSSNHRVRESRVRQPFAGIFGGCVGAEPSSPPHEKG